MNSDELESRLQRTPLRQPPPEWRRQILVAANTSRRTSSTRELTFAATLRELFWPHPVAWGAMAAVWLMLAGIHLAMREPGSASRALPMASSSEAPTLMTLQRELLATLDQPAERPKPKQDAARPLPPQSCIGQRRETFEV